MSLHCTFLKHIISYKLRILSIITHNYNMDFARMRYRDDDDYTSVPSPILVSLPSLPRRLFAIILPLVWRTARRLISLCFIATLPGMLITPSAACRVRSIHARYTGFRHFDDYVSGKRRRYFSSRGRQARHISAYAITGGKASRWSFSRIRENKVYFASHAFIIHSYSWVYLNTYTCYCHTQY